MDDYPNASERHLKDAELLFAENPSRLANASHLFGISAECSLKAIARKFNAAAKFSGNKGHIPELFSELQNICPSIGSNADLVRHIGSIKPQFVSWNIAQRYALETTFVQASVAGQQMGSRSAYLLMSNCLEELI